MLNFIQKSSGGGVIYKIISLIFLSTLLFGEYNVTLQLKWKNAFQFAGFYMAKEKGFYKKEGLNVTIKEFNGSDVVKEVLTNQAQFGISDFNLIKYRLMGKKVVAVMPIFEYTPLAIVSINSNIKKVKDFENHTICTPKSYINSVISNLFFIENNIDIKKLKLKEQFFNLESLKNKICDLYVVYDTDQPYYLKKLHIPYKIFKFKNYKVNLYGDILFTSEKFRFSHPDIVEKFRTATIKGWEYALNHIDETIKIILKKYNTQHFSYDKLKDEAIKTKKYIGDFKFNINKINYIKTLTKLSLKLKGDFDIVDFIYSPYIKTKQEANFLKTHIIITANTVKWPPFLMQKDGKMTGIAKDFFNIIKQNLFLKTRDLIANKWSDVLELIKAKKADLTFITSKTSQKEKYAIFSLPYAKYNIAIATKKDISFIPNMNFLKNKKIAIGKDYTAYHMLVNNYPNLDIMEVVDTKKALEMLEENRVDAVIDILPVLAYYISYLNFDDIKISGTTPFKFNASFMIRDDYKLLKTMINRVIKDISQKQKDEIMKKYISVNVQKGYPKKYVEVTYFWFSVIVAGLVIVILIVIYQLFKIKSLSKKLEVMAYYDKLTQIYNRAKFRNILEEFINFSNRYKTPLSLIYFDLDHFKDINDTYGHEKGDFVLKEAVKVVKKHLRESDIIGRWGGEEFLILLPNTDKKGALKVAENIRKAIEKHSFDGLKLTISFGVTEFNFNESIDEFIDRADMALYKAKKSGRNRVEVA